MNTSISRRQLMGLAAANVAFASVPLTARAQTTLPTLLDNVRVVCGFPPGGTTDTVARRVSERLAGTFAKTSTVENRPGAGGRIAVEVVKNAAPNGQTLLLTPGSMLFLYPHIYKQLSYNPFNDLAPVSSGANNVHALAVGPMVPESVRTVPDFLAWCRANADKANYGTPGAGSTPHFIGMLLEKAAGVPLTHVSFKGVQDAIVNMLGGQLPAVVGPEGNFMVHAKGGKLRVLGTSGQTRSRFMPEVPTFTEQGLRTIQVQEWFGFFMPANTPQEIVQRASTAIAAALKEQDVISNFAQTAMDAAASTPVELARRLKADHDYWAPVVKTSGFTADS